MSKANLDANSKFSWSVRVYDRETNELLRTITGLTSGVAAKLHEEYTAAGYYVGSGNW